MRDYRDRSGGIPLRRSIGIAGLLTATALGTALLPVRAAAQAGINPVPNLIPKSKPSRAAEPVQTEARHGSSQSATAVPSGGSTPDSTSTGVTLPEIEVAVGDGAGPSTFAGGQVGSGTEVGILGKRTLFNTPFSTIGYTEKLVRDQQARTVSDVTDNNPSIRTNSPRYSGIDGFLIRGFPVFSSEIALDGLYGILDQRRPALEPIERVEILEGPSTPLTGVPPFGNVGGTINFIPKRATDVPVTRLTAGFASSGQPGAHVDVGRRFGPNSEWGMRFNGAYRDGLTPINFQRERFGVAALALDYRGERLRLTADLEYQEQDLDAPTRVRTVLPGFAIPASPSLRINPQQPWEYYNSNHWHSAFRGEYDLSENVTAYAAYGHGHFEELFFGGTLQINTARGDFQSTPNLTPAQTESNTAEVGLRGRFDTGPIHHQVAVSAVGLWQDSGIINRPVGPAIRSNIFNPIYVLPRTPSGLSQSAPRTSLRANRGAAIADTLSAFDDRVILTLVGRWQDVDVRNFSTSTGLPTSSSRNAAFTPAVGLVLKPLQNLSIYGNYIEGLTSGGVAPANAINAGQAFPAIVTRQMEVGAKCDFGTFGVSAAAFQITQPSGFTDPTTRIFSVNGQQRNRGLEFNVFGEPAIGLRLLGGVALLDGVLTRAGGINDGKAAVGVPNVQFNLYGEYDLPLWLAQGMTLTGRVIFTSSQFYDQGNTQKISDWTRVDLGARYSLNVQGLPITVRASVENVLDYNYWATTGRGLLTPGTPRTYLVSASFDF